MTRRTPRLGAAVTDRADDTAPNLEEDAYNAG